MKFKVIAAVKNDDELKLALDSNVEIIFHLTPNIIKLKKHVNMAHSSGKKIFIHIDFAEGIAKDLYGMKMVKVLGVDGIISTKANIIKFAKEEGLSTVQRFFIIDSRSIESTIESIKQSRTDMIEVMPGIIPKVISKLKERIIIPIIAGGLIETNEEANAAFDAGATAISTGSKILWK